MKKLNVDIAITGAGSAGMNAFRTAKAWTDKVILIAGGEYRTTCARVGCMPSKLLIAAAEAAHAVNQASQFGVNTHGVDIDDVAVMDRVRRERDRFVGFVVDSVETVQQMLGMPFYHPVIEEGVRTALRDAQIQLDQRVLRAA